MSRGRKQRRSRREPAARDRVAWRVVLEWAAFVVIAGLLSARPLIGETFQRIGFSFLPQTGGITPAFTVTVDALLLAAGTVALIARPIALRRVPWWLLAGITLLAIAVALSSAYAQQPRAALNAGSGVLVLAIAGASVARLLNTPARRAVLLSLLLAAGLATAAKCFVQVGYEFEDTRQFWVERKEQLRAHGMDLDTPAVRNYERRLTGAEAFGYLAHPNVAAGCLAMWILLAAGVAAAACRRVDDPQRRSRAVVAGALGLVLLGAMWFTGSMGAAIGLLAGCGLFIAAQLPKFRTRPRRLLRLAVASYLGLIALGAGWGVLRGSLPHPSLAFRWQYWTAAVRAFEEAPLTGIGRENFRTYFLKYRPPTATEEVGNPHNLWLTLGVETGPVGLIAGVLLIGGVLLRTVPRGASGQRGSPRSADLPHAYDRSMTVAAAAVAVVAVALGNLMPELRTAGSAAGAVAQLWLIQFVLPYALGLLLTWWILRGAVGTSPLLQWALLASLGAALVHALVGFTLTTPAGAALFVCAAALGTSLGLARAADSGARSASAGTVRGGAAVIVAAVTVAHVLAVAGPTVRVQGLLQGLAPRAARSWDEAARSLEARGRKLLNADPLAVAPPVELARQWLALAQAPGAESAQRAAARGHAAVALEAADKRGRSLGLAGARAILMEMEITARRSSGATIESDLARQYVDACREVVRLNPQDPRGQMKLAEAALTAWRTTENTEYRERARIAVKQARTIDAARPPEDASRLTPEESQRLSEIEGDLETRR